MNANAVNRESKNERQDGCFRHHVDCMRPGAYLREPNPAIVHNLPPQMRPSNPSCRDHGSIVIGTRRRRTRTNRRAREDRARLADRGRNDRPSVRWRLSRRNRFHASRNVSWPVGPTSERVLDPTRRGVTSARTPARGQDRALVTLNYRRDERRFR
jgi:hypothetical protein